MIRILCFKLIIIRPCVQTRMRSQTPCIQAFRAIRFLLLPTTALHRGDRVDFPLRPLSRHPHPSQRLSNAVFPMTRSKVFVVVGTRPEAIKMAPVYKALMAHAGMEPILISTGQHKTMLDQVFGWFGLEPDEDLGVMRPSQTLNGVLTRSLSGLDELITKHRPDSILAQGDTTTVLAAALASFNRGLRFGHVEAGLRTYDLEQPYPEEGFRQMASRVATWHFAPTQRAVERLEDENVQGEIHMVGNTVIDALELTAMGHPDTGLKLDGSDLCLITGHRRENHGDGFRRIFKGLADLAAAFPDIRFVYPVHLNPRVREAVDETLAGIGNLTLIDPVPYPQMVALMKAAKLIITDSGGIQEEAPSFQTPVLVMRETTERQEAVEAGVAKLVGTDPDVLYREASKLLTDKSAHAAMTRETNPFGDGKSSRRIVEILAR